MKAEDSLTLLVVDALAAQGVPYLLSGSFASNYYGFPRSTNDADFVVQLDKGVGSEFAKRLGPDFELDPQLSFETLTGTFRQIARHRHSAFTIEFFLLSKDPHDQQRFARRREVGLFGRNVWLPSPEDVVISKLRWARRKDEADIRGVMAVQRTNLDWPYIRDWCRQHGTLAKLEEIRQMIPEI